VINSVDITLGTLDSSRSSTNSTNNNNDILKQEFFAVAAAIHPVFFPTTVTNDVALVRLDRPVGLTEAVQPACLPKKS